MRGVTPEELREQLVILQDKIQVQRNLDSGKEKAGMKRLSTRVKDILTSNMGLKILAVLVAV